MTRVRPPQDFLCVSQFGELHFLTHVQTNRNEMHLQIIVLFICFMCFTCSNAIQCDSCGKECTNACGTKHFRTCCFNYLRKRTDPDALRLSSNKRLIDFILLQGRALFTQELRERRHNNTLMDLDMNTYYG